MSSHTDTTSSLPKKEEQVMKSLVGQNVHSVYVFCFSCKTDGINFPLETKCGNCGSDETTTYYDIKTITNLVNQEIQKAREERDEEIKNYLEQERLAGCFPIYSNGFDAMWEALSHQSKEKV